MGCSMVDGYRTSQLAMGASNLHSFVLVPRTLSLFYNKNNKNKNNMFLSCLFQFTTLTCVRTVDASPDKKKPRSI